MKTPVCSTGLRWLWLTIVIIVADLGIKQLVLSDLNLYEPHPIMPFFNIMYAQNFGAAFSFLADEGGWQRWFFAGIAIGISVILMVMMYRQSAQKRLSNIAYALIIGGAIGNLSDRLVHGFVIDYLDFYVGNWHWPTFNLADMAICIGAALVIFEGFLPDKSKQEKAK
ncbi:MULTISPECIES: signal peptidase II [Providencia]|uniref:Lipoprotein signal peptidase n=2 Tax=Providencia TaxID=586 RepID=A0A2A5Q3F1_PRORE|nr:MULTISPECIES: signal peptidase II [Providencia]MRF67979.1 lipoprotein signal peptidase [Escherichia coli]EFE52961.1 signal peptidase II [Providencia rettgeri DSM 1131]EHZ6872124.1 signal peptidase II [Providencia rettgeri]MBG5894051.1 signal peptidase II [Providencia rettgeri]MBI6191320.1 signal peptidase II [Providencia rettgeri]